MAPSESNHGEKGIQLEKYIPSTTDTISPPTTSKTAVAVPPPTNEKTSSAGETLPGWTIMRPLRMRGLKSSKKGSGGGSQSGAGLNVGENKAPIDGWAGNGNKTQGDLKVTETNGTASPVGEEEVDPLREVRSDDELLGEEETENAHRGVSDDATADGALGGSDGMVYKVYKRRWFGLVQLALLNIIVSWDWLSFSANSTTASQYYKVTPSEINWLSTAFLFAFVAAAPMTIYTLHRGGPKPAIITASVLILLGNWIRYGSTKSGPNGNFAGVMVGQILTGLAQPFVLSAPTRYSDLWFTNRGRVAATAVMSLANPFGGALAQLIDPFWAGSAKDIPNLVLYISIISSVASIPSFFIPARPPTPSSPSGHTPKQPLLPSLRALFSLPEFYMIMIPFTLYVGLFNSISSLINQILQPYSFSENDAGIAGALLIVVGLVCSAITSPIIDRTKSYLLAMKLQVPIIAICYLAFTWAPQTRSIAAPYTILSLLGAASFSLVPVVLEYLIEITHPVSPEVTSTICWAGGQLLGGIFIIVSDALRAPGVNDGTADDGTKRPPGNMYKALIFQTVLAMVVVPLPLALGCCGRHPHIRMRRVEADKESQERRDMENTADGTADTLE